MKNLEQALNMLKNGVTQSFKMPKDSTLVVTSNAIVIRFFTDYRKEIKQAVLVAKIRGQLLGNSSALNDLIRHRGNSGAITPEQTYLADHVPMIPFDTMKQAGLSLNTFREVDKTPEETLYRTETKSRLSKSDADKLKGERDYKCADEVTYGYGEPPRFTVSYKAPRHFTGARLFQIGDKRFLLDVDRNELPHGIVNPFLVELPDASVNTVADAYESLKPQLVIDAEIAEAYDSLKPQTKSKVLRQGEWFFVPTTQIEKQQASEALRDVVETALKNNHADSWSWQVENAGRGVLRAGRNRPNNVTKFVELNGKFYVSGTVSHTGREHADLDLKDWYQAIPNTATTSWTITGDID